MSSRNNDNPKERGKNHRDNKKRYDQSRRGKTATPAFHSKSTTSLESNWDRYEQDEPLQALSSSTDFSILANTPISYGNHFQFKGDNQIDLTTIQAQDLFTLDLNLLSISLDTIESNKRNGIPDSYFSKNEKEVIVRKAKENELKYKAYLEKNGIKPLKSITFDYDAIQSEIHEKIETTNSELPPLGKCSIPPSVPSKAPDLEEWLDNILDD